MHTCTYASTNSDCKHGYNAILNGILSKTFEEKIRMVKKDETKEKKR